MNLFLFPSYPSLDNGYGQGVYFAYNKLQPKKDDTIVWYPSPSDKSIVAIGENDIIINKRPQISCVSIKNVILGRPRLELGKGDLGALKGLRPEKIHCDETLFYRAVRKIYPDAHLNIRFHNCYARIYARKKQLGVGLDWKYDYTLKAMHKLESEIFRDRNCRKIFISDEDRCYYTSMYGIQSDSETWPYSPDMELVRKSRTGDIRLGRKLVWFGGVDSHKYASIRWFINSVFSEIKRKFPDIEFHLWGAKTSQFNSPERGIFGYGYFNGNGFPMKDALYVNPDIIGGGIKMKLMPLMENGIPFISSPFGFEGYSSDLVDGKYCHVVESDKWAGYITDLLEKFK